MTVMIDEVDGDNDSGNDDNGDDDNGDGDNGNDDDFGDEDDDDGEKRDDDKCNLYDKKFNPHCLAHGNNKAKEGLGFLLPDINAIIIKHSSYHYLAPLGALHGAFLFFTQPSVTELQQALIGHDIFIIIIITRPRTAFGRLGLGLVPCVVLLVPVSF